MLLIMIILDCCHRSCSIQISLLVSANGLCHTAYIGLILGEVLLVRARLAASSRLLHAGGRLLMLDAGVVYCGWKKKSMKTRTN